MFNGGRFLLYTLLVSIIATAAFASDFSDDGVWQHISKPTIQKLGMRAITPRSYLTFQLNREMLQGILRQAPMEFTTDAITRNVVLSLPKPDGAFERFRIEESPMMEAGLARQYPEVKTYRGQGIDDPFATVRLGWTSGGFHAFVLSTNRSFYVGVYQYGDTTNYVSFWQDQDAVLTKPIECLVKDKIGGEKVKGMLSAPLPQVTSGATLHTYRAAIAATGEYTQKFPPGTQDSALNNGIIPTINSLNAILEREFTIHFNLVANDKNIIFTDPTTDPYTATDPATMLGQNQTTVDSKIGASNYDIGHVFGGVGGSGIAYVGITCFDSLKAQGVSTYTNPIGTTFLVDLVAHEVGHQLGANHSYNGTTGSCGPNRNSSTAWEPGSGSTIMSYSGSCGAENTQGYSDPYYHTGSYDEIIASTIGDTCDVETASGNNPPTVSAGPDYTIPASTPFTLTATGSDADGDPLTFLWEEKDLGTASPPLTDDGTRPIFRTWQPVSSPSRTFPRLSDILDGSLTIGEAWPTTNRTLNFRVTARDNHTGAGGVAYDNMVVTVVNNGAGSFMVTDPNTAQTWTGGTNVPVTWNVYGTNAAPINVANVKISLSTDGGLTFPTVLLASTPNNGSATVTVPSLSTITARVKVEAIGNIFFDISDVNFSISTAGCNPITVNPASLPAGVVGTAYNQTISATGGTSPYTFHVTSGSLPNGISLSTAGALTGTPSAAGTFNFAITATDNNGCNGLRSYTIVITSTTCKFCDDFNNGVLSTTWTYMKPAWTESGGYLVGSPTGKKAMAIATPVYAGCSSCTFDAKIRTTGGIGSLVGFFAWWGDAKNWVELQMKEGSDLWLFKQVANGSLVAKKKVSAVINPNTTYDAKIVYTGTQFQVYINGTLLITVPKGTGTNPNGTLGFEVKATSASIDSVSVN